MFFYLVTSGHILPPFLLQMTASHCLQKWKWWLTLVWPLLWGQMCLCDNFSLALCLAFQKLGKQKKCQISTAPQRVETHQPLLALTRHLCSLSSRRGTSKAAKLKGSCVKNKESGGGEARSTQDVSRCWPWNVHFVGERCEEVVAYCSRASQRCFIKHGPVRWEGREEGAFNVSVTWGDTAEGYHPSKQTTDKYVEWLDAMEMGGNFTDPLLHFFFACNFGKTPRGAKVKHTGLIMDRIVFSSTVCFCLQLNNSVLVDKQMIY